MNIPRNCDCAQFVADEPIDRDSRLHGKTRSPLHLPRRLARLQGLVTGIRIERLQDISKEDAINEGIKSEGTFGALKAWKDYGGMFTCLASPIDSYQSLWDSINAKLGTWWCDNPWVWVNGLGVEK